MFCRYSVICHSVQLSRRITDARLYTTDSLESALMYVSYRCLEDDSKLPLRKRSAGSASNSMSVTNCCSACSMYRRRIVHCCDLSLYVCVHTLSTRSSTHEPINKKAKTSLFTIWNPLFTSVPEKVDLQWIQLAFFFSRNAAQHGMKPHLEFWNR